ncbi:Uncharacterized protein K02A2.6 [Exaiptasia diaphana]|nr:Uncharacterized protein K02A2.6 [Exaiptasia diaphana]
MLKISRLPHRNIVHIRNRPQTAGPTTRHKEVINYVQESWPDKDQLNGITRHYWPFRASLTIIDGLLMYDSRIVIPSSLRQDILGKLHEGHQGIAKCRRLAIQSVWWPGLSKNIKELIENCRVCCQAKRSHPEPLNPTVMPQRPWQKLAADLMEIKKSQYLVVIDYYSRYIELAKLENSTTSKEVINHLKSIMARHGIPETMLTDNGPQFSSKEFSLFANEYGFSHLNKLPKKGPNLTQSTPTTANKERTKPEQPTAQQNAREAKAMLSPHLQPTLQTRSGRTIRKPDRLIEQ